jgi:plastocyanin
VADTPLVIPAALRPLLTFAVLCLAPPAGAAIHGTVHVPATGPHAAGPLNAYPGRAGAMPGMHTSPRGRVSDAVVYVAQVPAAAELAPANAPRPQLAQKDESFVPRVVPVAVGTAVEFPNLDPIYHNVFSLSPSKRFDLGKYPKGRSKRVVFDRTGVVKVYCDIHSEMEAFVLVLPHRAFTQPGPDGGFELPELPPRRYELRVWHPDFAQVVREVVVPASGDLRVDLTL